MIDHLLWCTFAAMIAVAAASALRRQSAALRYVILLIALIRFALPTHWLAVAGNMLARRLPALPPSPQFADFPLYLLRTPGFDAIPQVAPASNLLANAALSLWALGCALSLGLWMRRLRQKVEVVRLPDPAEIDAFLEARRSIGISAGVELRIARADHVPAARGWLRPSVVLPEGLSAQLSQSELRAILAHELAHVRRRDNLSAAMARVIVSAFWFHPLLWWIERRLLAERERACDELVLAHGASPQDYVAAILKICRMSFAGAAGYAGATGSNLKDRMEQIMSAKIIRMQSRTLCAALGVLVTVALLIPLASGFLQAQPVPAPDSAAANALFRQGQAQLEEGKLQEAEETFRKLRDAEPGNARGIMGQVEVYMKQGREEDAVRLLQSESDKNPARMDLHMALGNTAVRTKRFELAIAEFQRVLDNTATDSKAAADGYLRLGETFRRKGDLNGAIAALQQGKTADPTNAMIVSTLALVLDSAGRKQEARQAYEEALRLNPKNGIALNNLAYLLSETGGDLNTALDYAQRAKEVLPSMLEVTDTVGWIYLKQKETDKAIETFRDLVQKAPDNQEFRKHLAMAQAQKR